MAETAEQLKRVSYIWSEELQRVSDQLPSNIGRSSLVHDLVRCFDLVRDDQSHGKMKGAVTQDRSIQGDGLDGVEGAKVGEGVERLDIEEDGQVDKEDNTEEDEDDTEEYEYDSLPSAEVDIQPQPSKWARVVEPNTTLFGHKDNLERYHDSSYVEYLLNPETTFDSDEEEQGDPSDGSEEYTPPRKRRKQVHGLEHDCPSFPSLPQYTRLVASATQTACLELVNNHADISITWDGGRHHALRNKASGFCYVADIVLGIMLLVKQGRPSPGPNESDPIKRRPRVMYVDLDIHEGDGVHQAFLSPTRYTIPSKKPAPNVLTLSIHHHSKTFFPPHKPFSSLPPPETKHLFTLSIPLKAYPGPKTYADIWPNVTLVKEAFKPDYVVLQLGVDGLPRDRVGQFGAWDIESQGGLAWCVQKIRDWGVPLCVTGGGGYDHSNTARAWTVATSVLLGRPLEPEREIPHHDHFPLYSPSFTLEVPPSHAKDENDEEYLREIRETYEVIAKRIDEIVSPVTA